MGDPRAECLSRAIRASGLAWAGCGSLSESLRSFVVCRCCITWLNTVEALLPLSLTCLSWAGALEQQIDMGEVPVVVTFPCVALLLRQPQETRSSLVSLLSRAAQTSLFLDFSRVSGPAALQSAAEKIGKDIFTGMHHAAELSLDLEAWDSPLGSFVMELCRLISRSTHTLDTLQLRGATLHRRMRVLLVSGCSIDSLPRRPLSPSIEANCASSNARSRSSNDCSSGISSNSEPPQNWGVTSKRTEEEQDNGEPSPLHPQLRRPLPSPPASGAFSVPVSPPLSPPHASAVAAETAAATAAPRSDDCPISLGSASWETFKGSVSCLTDWGSSPGDSPRLSPQGLRKRNLFYLPILKRLTVEGFQLLEFFEAPKLQENAITLTSEAHRHESIFRMQEAGLSSQRGLRGPLQVPVHRYWGSEVSFTHPCLAVRFISLNGAHLRVMDIVGFMEPPAKSGVIKWIRRALESTNKNASANKQRLQQQQKELPDQQPAAQAEGWPTAEANTKKTEDCPLVEAYEMGAPRGARESFPSGPGMACGATEHSEMYCRECILLRQGETGTSAWIGCCRLPELEELRLDDITFLAFISAPCLRQLEVNVCNSGEWLLLLEFLRLYGCHLTRLSVWAEDVPSNWLDTVPSDRHAGRPEGLAGSKTSAETALLVSFLHRHALTWGGAAATPQENLRQAPAGAIRRVSSASMLRAVGLQHLRGLSCPSCLLAELSAASSVLPALKNLDTWGDSRRLTTFLQQKRQLETVRVRGLTGSKNVSTWTESSSSGNMSNETAPHKGILLKSDRLRGLRSSASAAFLQEADALTEFSGPGCILNAWQLCPKLKRLELIENAELADQYLLSGCTPHLETLLYGGRLVVPPPELAQACQGLRQLRVLHALVLDLANFPDPSDLQTSQRPAPGGVEGVIWGPGPLPDLWASPVSSRVTPLKTEQRDPYAPEKQATSGPPVRFLEGLEQLYVHRLMTAPRTFHHYLKAARRLRLVAFQRCVGVSLSSVVCTLQNFGFTRLQQDTLPNPECRAFAASFNGGKVRDRFVVMKREASGT
ncbi:hypothetical protein, conserved [Eimeria tenella]|uniref:Uncharacterized protein n=1 Tax=Eimeria tenella TaxID=5802 RepID=U6KVE7_EIMTE|nr:hypothetical protein, conserved [Eimeria tenella]CDJ41921.1 hypothetical protein, conserved [Eimeria tenella]|eukprot:XP_013232671.1 hypothetical protein, conserved [Eimeria tenella]